MKNGDRIRTVSDELLAEALMCPNENGLGHIPCDQSDNSNCYECVLTWLKQEETRCRICGCTAFKACPGGCCWVEEDLCSFCKDKEEKEEGERHV